MILRAITLSAAVVYAGISTEARALSGCLRWSSYEIKPGAVVYRSSPDDNQGRHFGADASTFRLLGSSVTFPLFPLRCRAGYGADKDAVYYEGVKVTGADPHSFEVVEGGYAKDVDRWYGNGEALATRRGGELQVLASGYAVHPEGVFFGERRIEAEGFEVLSYWYARSKNHAYFMGVAIAGVEGASFRLLDRHASIARDEKSIVINGSIDGRFDAPSFEVLESGALVKDRKHVYFGFKPVRGADPLTSVSIGRGYWRDGKSVYYRTQEIAGADPVSFRLTPRKAYGVDSDRIYIEGVAVCKLAKDSLPDEPLCDLASNRR